MNKFNQHPFPCVRCLYPTAPGYGRFVNRVPGDYELEHDDGTIEYRDGYHCAWCLSPECDRCGKTIMMYEEIRHLDLYSKELDDLDDEFEDGSYNVHAECLTPAEIETMKENHKALYEARKEEFQVPPQETKPHGRPLATGAFATRKELITSVMESYNAKHRKGRWSLQTLADNNGISYTALRTILKEQNAT